MALSLPEGFPTDHITWESRGYDGPDGVDDVVEAPGALFGIPYSRAFRRLGPGRFAVKGVIGRYDDGPETYCETVWSAIRALGPEYREHAGMFNSRKHDMKLLDGGLYFNAADVGFSGPPTLHLIGNRALRLVCHRLGLKQPKRFPDEKRVPELAELETELLDQIRQEAAAAKD